MPTPAATERSDARKEPSPARSESPDTKGKRKAIEVLSSDDEDERPAHRASTAGVRASASAGPSGSPTSARPPARKTAVIDLTLSSDEEDDDDDEEESPMSQHYRLAKQGRSDLAIAQALGLDRPPTPPLPGSLGPGTFARSLSDGRVPGVNDNRSVSAGSAGSSGYHAPPRAAPATGFGLSTARYDPTSGAAANGGSSRRWEDYVRRPDPAAQPSGRPGLTSAPPSSTAVAGANGSNGSARLQPPASSLHDPNSRADELKRLVEWHVQRHGHDSDETEDEEESERAARRRDLERALEDAAAW